MRHALIVFSHLRWNFVYQRPQHLLSRLAKHYRIYFFEEPITGADQDHLQVSEESPGIVVCRPHSRITAPGFHDDQLPVLRTLLSQLIEREGINDHSVWFYSPMALPLLQSLKPKRVIYDCMDELSAFRNAPRQLLQRESALLKVADVVFTGGLSLYRAKRERHPAVYCFPSSVDAAHFSKGCDPAAEHPAQRDLARPRLGYFGVIDERIDLPLIAAIASARPHWQISLVGPCVKIDPATLPRLDNIHYFGQQSYEDLPRFLAGWDVCLQPFAMNESTKYISPTKTLEYMAALKPIVSTPIADVVASYKGIVRIAADPAEFLEACERALSETAEDRAQREEAMRATLERTSWDDTARRMHEIMEGIDVTKRRATNIDRAEADEHARAATGVAPSRAAEHHSTVILGAGPTGLSAAYHLGEGSLLLEQCEQIGGWCRSVQDNGFTFDYAGHIMFSNDPYVHRMYKMLLGDNVHWQNREAWIYSNEVYTRYPFQGALYGLPPNVLKECIVGAIEARFGALKTPATSLASAAKCARGSSTSEGKAESITDCCADGVTESTAPLGHATATSTSGSAEPANFEEFIYKVWGAGVAKHFAIPYNRKLWATPLNEMETSWLGGRVPLPDLEEMIEGALRPVAKPVGPNARFGYPLKGGFQALMNGFLPHLRGKVRTNAKVVKVQPGKRLVTLQDGSTYRYESLISTLPLPKLVSMIGAEAPAHVVAAAQGLRHVSVRCVNLGIGRENVTDKHWIYYPGETVFHRIFVQGNASPHCNPKGGFGITCEITYSPSKPLPCEGSELIQRCIEDCISVGLIKADDPILAANEIDMPYAYVVYDHARKTHVETIRTWLQEHDILLSGRYSEWEYYNSDHAFIAGKKAADTVLEHYAEQRPVEALQGA
ncbi:MAG: FAD-dependent oxidoreductase [Povalibacter sp.]